MNAKHRETKWVHGPGGWSCACCGPAPRHRAAARRNERRVAAQQFARELAGELITPQT